MIYCLRVQKHKSIPQCFFHAFVFFVLLFPDLSRETANTRGCNTMRNVIHIEPGVGRRSGGEGSCRRRVTSHQTLLMRNAADTLTTVHLRYESLPVANIDDNNIIRILCAGYGNNVSGISISEQTGVFDINGQTVIPYTRSPINFPGPQRTN